MKIKKIITHALVLSMMLLIAIPSMANDGMEFFFSNSRIFVVFLVVLVILLGLFVYLFRMDKRLRGLEKEIRNRGEE